MSDAAQCMDPHSKSNFHQVVVKSYDWKVEVDFSSKKLICSLAIHATTLEDGCTQMVSSKEWSLTQCDLGC